MNGVKKWIIITLMILYVVSPVDANPSPIDDAIVLLIGLVAIKGSNMLGN